MSEYQHLEDVLPGFTDALKKGAEADLGMPLGQAEKLLKKIREAKTNSPTISTRGLDSEKASKYVKIFRGADIALPVIQQRGSLIGDSMGELAVKKESERRTRNRKELLTKLDDVAEEIKTEAQTEFDKSCEEFRQRMQDYSAIFENTASGLNRQVEKLTTTLDRLGTLLSSAAPWHSKSP
jgi:DNA-binding transcriptional MerR regulator